MARRPGAEQQTIDPGPESQRLDKWLWFARIAKTRTLAASLVSDGRVRVNRQRVTKPAQVVKIGDVITVSVARGVRVLRIKAAGMRRGPAAEADTLYEELVPLPSGRRDVAGDGGEAAAGAEVASAAGELPGSVFQAPAGKGRPTKRERRELDRFKARFDDS